MVFSQNPSSFLHVLQEIKIPNFYFLQFLTICNVYLKKSKTISASISLYSHEILFYLVCNIPIGNCFD